ncbi:MAG: ABC transporter permease subunit [Acidimicrobiia bacterium]
MSWLALTRWEWFKLRGRRVIWVLLAIIVLFSSLIVVFRFGDYQFQKDRTIRDEILLVPGAPKVDADVDCEAFVAGIMPDDLPSPLRVEHIDVELTQRECLKEIEEIEDRLAMLVDDFTLPGAIPKGLRWTQLISIPFLAFFTVLVVGSEYGWGTLRTVLMRGTGRWRFLSVKLALIVLALAVTWILVLLTILATSAIVTPFASGIGHGDWTAGAVGDVFSDTARAWVSGLPYVALAALLTVLFSNWAGGMLTATAVSVGYFFFELFSVGRLIKLFDGVAAFRWFGTFAEFDLGWNTAAWMFGEGGQPIPGFALAGAIGVAEYPSDLHAFLVQMAYLAALLALAFWLFQRRDVAGPTG